MKKFNLLHVAGTLRHIMCHMRGYQFFSVFLSKKKCVIELFLSVRLSFKLLFHILNHLCYDKLIWKSKQPVKLLFFSSSKSFITKFAYKFLPLVYFYA